MKNIIVPKIKDDNVEVDLVQQLKDKLDPIVISIGDGIDFAETLNNNIAQVAADWSRVLTDSPSYEDWTAQRSYLVSQVASIKGLQEVTVNDFMTRVCTYMKDTFDLVKPKKEGKARVLSAKRQEEKAVLDAMSDDDLTSGIEAAKESNQFKQAEKLTKEVANREKAVVKVAKDATKAIQKDYFQELGKHNREGLTTPRHIAGAIAYAKADDSLKNQVCDLLGVAED